MSQPRSDAPPLTFAEPAMADWQPLPPRSRLLFLLGTAPWLAVAGAVSGSMIGKLAIVLLGDAAQPELTGALSGGALGLLLGAGFGVWLGHKQYRHTCWRLDAEGLALRRGRMWQRETRVPITRVQHLDIKRGPLQRYRDLATLTVHTAGTRNNSVIVPNIDFYDAEYLRDRLGRQLDLDDED